MAKKEECRIKPWCELSKCPYPYAVQCKHCKHYTETISESEKEEPAKKPIKTWLYCVKAKPYLTKVVESGRYSTVGKKDMRTLGYATEGELKEASLNGTVCFECEIVEAEKISVSPFPFANGDYQYGTKTLTPDALEARSCLSVRELNDYDPKHALYLENVKEIKPFEIPSLELIKDNGSTSRIPVKSLSRAPQNMCWAWVWNDEERKWERVLILSIQSKNLVNIANGLKDIETRRVVVKEIKEKENEKAI